MELTSQFAKLFHGECKQSGRAFYLFFLARIRSRLASADIRPSDPDAGPRPPGIAPQSFDVDPKARAGSQESGSG